MTHPSYEDLVKHLERFGPGGIVESANHLSEDEQAKLAALVKKATKKKRRR